MSIYKDRKTGNWVVTLRYKDLDGIIKRRAKRGFTTKREAKDWKDDFLSSISHVEAKEMEMTFEEFYKVYLSDISNLIRTNTLQTKEIIVSRHILPYFRNKVFSKITTPEIIRWQNEILGKNFKDTYSRTINNQLVAIFNHAEKYYDLGKNPMKKTTAIGNKNSNNIDFWTKDEFDQFISVVDEEVDYIHFTVLFYTGIRIGELIAIRLKNINFEKGHIEIRESAQYVGGQYVFSKTKTTKSERIVTIPAFLNDLIRNHVEKLYFMDMEEQVFLTNKVRLAKQLTKYAEKAKVKKIRIHDLRHSHASLLIEQGVQPNIVQERLGHEKIETTLKTYSHMYPNKQYYLADFLNQLAGNKAPEISRVDNPLLIETIK